MGAMQYCLECPGTHLPGSAEWGVSGDKRAGANPTWLVCQPLARSHWGPGGSQQKTGGLCHLLPPARPRVPRPSLQPQSSAGAISPAQAGRAHSPCSRASAQRALPPSSRLVPWSFH